MSKRKTSVHTWFRKLLLIVYIILIATSVIYCQSKQEKLIVFHFDFNSVSLNKDYVIKWLNKASQMGYNAVLWEIEDDVKWVTCPECSSPDAFTKAEFKEIIEYSRALGLEPIPLLQTIGHAEYVLQHEKYYPLREDSNRYDCYCTSNKDVRSFIKNWIIEYLELFGNLKYFHLGGDEAYAFATCSVCKATAEKIGKNKLYADYLNDIAQPLLNNNIRPGIWSDMILSHPNELAVISKEFIFWDWNYWDGDSVPERVMVWGEGRLTKEKITAEMKNRIPQIFDKNNNLTPFYTSDYLKQEGYDIILCSSSRCYGDAIFVGKNDLHIDNIIGAARKASKLDLLGTCVTSWAVRIPNYETQEMWLNLAPFTINNPSLSKENILEKILRHLFKINNSDISKAFEKISYSFPFSNNNTTGIMWTGLKDSKPAPAGYINELISRWKNKNQWNEIKESISRSPSEITLGLNELNNVIPKINGGYEIIENWTKAAYFQFWQAVLANKILGKDSCESEIDNQEIMNLITSLKKEYTNWAREWMTEKSADINAGLIYDVFINHFN